MYRKTLCALVFLFSNGYSCADEGMWLLDQPPRKLLKEKYNFDLTDAWLERAMKASIRFNNGGSGSFVSTDGLVVTNHHIGLDSIQKLSGPGKNYFDEGFYAKTPAGELKCLDLELNVLQSIEDITARVLGAVKSQMSPAQAGAARRAMITEIEQESTKSTGMRSDVVTLYQGGQYHLYRYKKYTDVRLVFTPENAIGQFGGDVDNFEYPRHGFDVCFFRVWENGTPLKTDHWFKWSQKGPKEQDLVFVSGHPGSTNRLETMARLKHRRDLTLPYMLGRLRNLEALLEQFSATGPAQAAAAHTDYHSAANSRKALTGQYQGLLDPGVVKLKKEAEEAFKKLVFADPANKSAYGDAWDVIEKSQNALATIEKEYALLESEDAFNSRLFRIARHLVRMAEELPKKDTERLREYRESALASLKFQLYSPAPISKELERVKLAGALTFLAEQLGGEHALVAKVLQGKSPAALVTETVNGSILFDPKERQRLADGGRKALDACDDPMIRLASHIDADARQLRKRFEIEVDEPEQQAYAKLAKARFDLFGASIPPDATFTLRLAFGTVSGYRVDGNDLPFHTTFASAYERAKQMGNKSPFDLPKSWLAAQSRVDLKAPFNFVSTSDTIGGNSGSPVLNRSGELVGINFDRNRHGLVRNYVYTDEQARHISVHSAGILKALDAIYGATTLVDELVKAK